MKAFLYVIGDNPYENSHKERDGNGDWHTTAQNVEDALKMIFGGMAFPAEPVGRKFFLDDLSLPGVSSNEVIQVWSDEPEIIERTRKLLGRNHPGGLHNGNGRDFGLHLEVKVTDINKYLSPDRTLIAAPANTNETTAVILSPMGASLVDFQARRHDMQMEVQAEQLGLMRKKWEMSRLSGDLDSKLRDMKQKLAILDAYLHGTRHRTQICSGTKGSGKYAVFQNRVYLSEEIALLANFKDFDFKNMESLEKWLVKSGRIWKFLPFERCILATRIRKEDKDYGHDAFTNLYNNMLNMQNMIWVRDGENVFHVDVEFKFQNAVFPDREQFERTVRVVQNHVWESSFAVQKKREKTIGDKAEDDVMGELKHGPLKEEEPYFTRRIVRERFTTIEKWLDSGSYTELLDKQLRQAVQDYLTKVNKRQMIFAVLLQGIVDNTELLDIPRGTDLFNWETVDKYFNLIYDYRQALPWHGISKKIEPYMDGKARRGEWIVAYVDEWVAGPTSYSNGTTYKDSKPIIFEVLSVEEGKPVVNYYPWMKRRAAGAAWGNRQRRKEPIKLILKNSDFMRMPLPPSLSEEILDDRDWKSKYQWAVPLMVNYKAVLKAFMEKKNFTFVEWKGVEDDY